MTRHFVTACHADQARVLGRSLDRHAGPHVLHVLAWDWEPRPLPNVEMTARRPFLLRHPEFAHLPGPPRSPCDTVCSVRWQFAVDVMEDCGTPVTMVDGDMWFWSSPEPVFNEIGTAALALSPHRFAPAVWGLPGVTYESHRQYGLFNAGFVHFGALAPARRMARWCRDWCYNGFRELGDRRLFGDQGYLELLREEFAAHVIQHSGLNVAPWNVHTAPIGLADGGLMHFGQRPLVSYHYSSLRLPGRLAFPEYELNARQIELLYRPYIAELAAEPTA